MKLYLNDDKSHVELCPLIGILLGLKDHCDSQTSSNLWVQILHYKFLEKQLLENHPALKGTIYNQRQL